MVLAAARFTVNRIGYGRSVSPLFLVNWHSVHLRFRALMWLLALGLTIVVLLEVAPPARPSHPIPRGMLVHAVATRAQP